MIIALLALAFAMILGGLFAAFLGWDIVLVERGWTMVLAGSISAASGALLLGITGAVAKLTRIQTELERLHGEFEREIFAEEAPEEETEARASGMSLAALSGALLSGKAFGRSGSGRKDDEREAFAPSAPESDLEEASKAEEPAVQAAELAETGRDLFTLPPKKETEEAEEPAASREEVEPEARVPDFLLVERRETYVETVVTNEEPPYAAETFSEEEGPRSEEPGTAPEREASEPAAETQDEEEAASRQEEVSGEERPATIIGTYNSGDNKYVMFSDGSIEAHTPRKVFRFQSLDELKEFIASGGEENSSAAT